MGGAYASYWCGVMAKWNLGFRKWEFPLMINIVTCTSDSGQGFGLDIGFIDHFNTQLVITRKYSSLTNFNTLQFTRAHTKSFAAYGVFTRHFLIMVSNNGYSSASGLKFSLNGSSFPTELFLLQLSLQLLCTDQVENTVSNSTSIVACVSVAAGMCLLSLCLETSVVYLLISRSLHSNDSMCYNIILKCT
jgi:hypothetical protein